VSSKIRVTILVEVGGPIRGDTWISSDKPPRIKPARIEWKYDHQTGDNFRFYDSQVQAAIDVAVLTAKELFKESP